MDSLTRGINERLNMSIYTVGLVLRYHLLRCSTPYQFPRYFLTRCFPSYVILYYPIRKIGMTYMYFVYTWPTCFLVCSTLRFWKWTMQCNHQTMQLSYKLVLTKIMEYGWIVLLQKKFLCRSCVFIYLLDLNFFLVEYTVTIPAHCRIVVALAYWW